MGTVEEGDRRPATLTHWRGTLCCWYQGASFTDGWQENLEEPCGCQPKGDLLNVSECRHYLSNPSNRVVIDGYSSSLTEIISGVPQGSTLGPLFFVLCIDDLPDVVCCNSNTLYADDSKTLLTLPIHLKTLMSCSFFLTRDLGNLN